MELIEMHRCLTKLKQHLPKWSPEITNELCKDWIIGLKEYPDLQIQQAMAWAIKDSKEWVPLSMIDRMCQGCNLSNEEIGIEVAGRILRAIGHFGGNRFKEAEEYIGEIGWLTVKRLGDWVKICDIENDDLPSARKLWRETATIIAKKYYSKNEDIPPMLPKKSNTVLEQAMKLAIGDKKP